MPIEHGHGEARHRFKALYARLGESLKHARHDDERVRALFVDAVAEYMRIAVDAGASPGEHPGALGCAQNLQGEPFDLAEATDEEFTKWTDMLADAADY